MSVYVASDTRPEHRAEADIDGLVLLAVRGLGQMFDPQKQLFCFRLKLSDCGLVKEGISPRYTMISLLGLHQLKTTTLPCPVEVTTVAETLLEETNWITNIGDLGLLLWLCALALPEQVEHIYFKLDVKSALSRYRDALERRSMELSWFLSGLAHSTLACGREFPGLEELALSTYRMLKNNQGDKGFFGHLDRAGSVSGLLRGRIGSFADQVYPIYALTRFAQAYKMNSNIAREALKMALNCAEAICRVQGPLGQWWWHYNSAAGAVVGQYPVYSVHQDGMAPMALFALSIASGQDFSEPVYRGLQWVVGNNELGRDLRDFSANVIWRSIYRPQYKLRLSYALNLLKPPTKLRECDDVMIKFECRPYHLGWFLYSFAGHNPSRTH
ncbi:MAG TPA: hypothetical protein VGL91_02885 [Acidobacteriota bacterium]|jgi:hypothetical protein